MSFERNNPFFEHRSSYSIAMVAEYAKEVLLTHSDTIVMPADEVGELSSYGTSWINEQTGFDVHLSAPEGLLADDFIVLDTREEGSGRDVQYVFRAEPLCITKYIETENDDDQKDESVKDEVACKTAYELLLQSGVSECRTSAEANERFWELAADYALGQPHVQSTVYIAARSVERGDYIEDGVEDVVQKAKLAHARHGSFSVGVTASRLAIAAEKRIKNRMNFNQASSK